jgi:hypothetical protein
VRLAKAEQGRLIGFAIDARHPGNRLGGKQELIQLLVNEPGDQALAGAPFAAQA